MHAQFQIMKIIIALLPIFALVICTTGCKKNNPSNNPGNTTSTGCLISTITINSPTSPGQMEHDSVEYNSQTQIKGYYKGAIKNGNNIGYSSNYKVSYDGQGH